MADAVAKGRFDLDDIGAHVGQQHAREGDGEGLGDFENPDAFERARCGVFVHGAGAYKQLPVLTNPRLPVLLRLLS